MSIPFCSDSLNGSVYASPEAVVMLPSSFLIIWLVIDLNSSFVNVPERTKSTPSGVFRDFSDSASYTTSRVPVSSIFVTSWMFFSWMLSMNESPTNASAATIVPISMKGVRLPSFDLHLSDIAPKIGSMNRARMLSRAMTTPDAVWDMPNLLVRMSGIVLS